MQTGCPGCPFVSCFLQLYNCNTTRSTLCFLLKEREKHTSTSDKNIFVFSCASNSDVFDRPIIPHSLPSCYDICGQFFLLFSICQLLLPSTCSRWTLVDCPFHRVSQSPFSTVQTFHFCQFHLLEPFFPTVFNVLTSVF